jgi:hypothetical protein
MKIENWQFTEQADTVQVSADVDGYRLWYRVPTPYRISRAGDPFLAAALLPAMHRSEKIEIDLSLSVSPKLLENVSLLQEILHSWIPKDLKMVDVSARTSTAEPLNTGVMSFFSGGVDSTYTFLKRLNEISHVVSIHGMDFYFESGSTRTFTVADIKDLAQFAWKLMLPYNPVSAYMKGRLSKPTLQAVSDFRDTGSDPGLVEAALVDDLNRIISGKSIYEERRFAGVHLRPRTRQLLMRNMQGEELRDLNRLLLEDAYAREIVGKYGGAFKPAIERNTRFVQSFGKSLIPVETNFYAFGYRYNLSRDLSQGACLGSIALLLGMPRAFVPASYSYSQLVPLGSHPLTDPLWTNECMEIVHEGAEVGRLEKIRKISECESALANLRVCFHDANVNCGKCDKCLRTMISLKLLGVSDAPFPPLPPPQAIRKNLPVNIVELPYVRENLDLAMQSDDREMRDLLRDCVQKLERKRVIWDLDKSFLGGLINRAYCKIAKIPPTFHRINT